MAKNGLSDGVSDGGDPILLFARRNYEEFLNPIVSFLRDFWGGNFRIATSRVAHFGQEKTIRRGAEVGRISFRFSPTAITSGF